MSETSALDALRTALEPVSSLHGEHAQIVEWVQESFSTVESLHNELIEWQQELSNQQAALEERLATDKECESSSGEHNLCLEAAQQEMEQWAADSAAQLAVLEELEQQLADLAAERDAACGQAAELAAQAESERTRAAAEREAWLGELRAMRRLIEEKWNDQAKAKLAATTAAAASAAELRRRAQQRFEARREKSAPVDN